MSAHRLLLTVACALIVVGCCPPPVRPTPLNGWVVEDQQATAKLNDGGNGIYVEEPKVYDDASLRAMLDGIRTKLALLNGVNQDTLTSHLGLVSGAKISQTQFGLGVSTATPSVGTSAQGGTTSSATDATGATSTTSNSPSVTTTTTSPAAPTAPAIPSSLAFTPSSGVSPSSLDVLNEQMQLSYELANLQLLLEGSLSDLFVKNERYIKQRVTMGFPIALRPRPEYKNAVAVVEVEATVASTGRSNEAPAVTALLPREKTYNVAAMTDRTTSIGASAILGAISLGGSFLSGHKTLYLAKDQDTVAMVLPALTDTAHTSRFSWEFHPVLGESYVRGGPKQTFVQLAFPMSPQADCFGVISIRTYWRRFDQETGLVGDVIPGSVLQLKHPVSVTNYKLEPIIDSAEATDLGDGNLMVSVHGTFLNGTYIQLGPNRYDAPKNLIVEDAGLKFVAPASAFAQWTARVVSRNGKSVKVSTGGSLVKALDQLACANNLDPAKKDLDCKDQKPPDKKPACDSSAITFVGDPIIEPFDESKTLLRLQVRTVCDSPDALPDDLLLSIGGKVFGLRDAPIFRQSEDSARRMFMMAIVPTDLLLAREARITVFSPLRTDVEGYESASWGEPRLADQANSLYASKSVRKTFDLDSEAERLVLVSLDKAGTATFVMYGNGLDGAKVILPTSGATIEIVRGIHGRQTRYLKITKPALAQAKKLVLLKTDSVRPTVIDVPAIPADKGKGATDAETKAKVSVDAPLVQNTQEVDVAVDQAASLVSIKMQDKELHWKLTDKATVRMITLKDDGVTTDQKSVTLTFAYKNGDKEKLSFDVVAARIYVKQPPPAKKS